MKDLAVSHQFLKFALVGLVSNVGGYLIYMMATYAGIPPKTAMTFLYAMGTIIGYCGNRKLTFIFEGSLLASGYRYLSTYLVGYFINLLILFVFVDRLGYPHAIIQAIAIFIVASFLFFTLKLFVFRDA
jgi:putative flippase GtrA